jgi:hypothetical protein
VNEISPHTRGPEKDPEEINMGTEIPECWGLQAPTTALPTWCHPTLLLRLNIYSSFILLLLTNPPVFSPCQGFSMPLHICFSDITP